MSGFSEEREGRYSTPLSHTGEGEVSRWIHVSPRQTTPTRALRAYPPRKGEGNRRQAFMSQALKSWPRETQWHNVR